MKTESVWLMFMMYMYATGHWITGSISAAIILWAIKDHRRR